MHSCKISLKKLVFNYKWVSFKCYRFFSYIQLCRDESDIEFQNHLFYYGLTWQFNARKICRSADNNDDDNDDARWQ